MIEDDLLRQLEALRRYESDLGREIAWHEQRRTHAMMVMAGRGGAMGPPAASMDRHGRPLPDDQVIGPSATEAAASLQTANEELGRLKPALVEIRRQIRQLEARIQSGKKTVARPPETYLSPRGGDEAPAQRREPGRREALVPAPSTPYNESFTPGTTDGRARGKAGKGSSAGAIDPADF